MIELDAENAIPFLRAHGWIGDGPAVAEVLSGGVSNQVIRIITDDRLYVLKQSRPQLRVKDDWFSDTSRIYRELEVMQALEPLLPTGVVPKVLRTDYEQFAYLMSHAPLEAEPWKTRLLAGDINADMGMLAGRNLGEIHEAGATHADRFRAFADHAVYVQLRVDPFYRRVMERRPEVAVHVGRIVEEMLAVKESLCHGDYTPKNMLMHAGGMTLVDYETAHFGDPTMDLGLFLAHLVLKAFRSPARYEQHERLMRAFWSGYTDGVRYRRHAVLESRGAQHLGVCLLARIDGTSPVDYLPEEAKRDAVRRLGRAILRDGVSTWNDVWDFCRRETASFA
jgi:5-methylthioribose kinase